MRILIIAALLAATPAFAESRVYPIQREKGQTCPTGYYGSGGGCVPYHRDTPPAIPKTKGMSCPSGTYASGDFCKAFR